MRSRSFGCRLPASVVAQRAKASVGSALNRLGVNFNQIARRMNEGEGAPPELLALLARTNAELDRIYDPVFWDDPEADP